MNEIGEQATKGGTSNGTPRAAEEATTALLEKALLDLRLLPTTWEQKLFERWWLPLAMLAPIAVLFLIGLMLDTHLYLTELRRRSMPFQLDHRYLSRDVIYISLALLFAVVAWLLQRHLRQTPRALRRLWRHGVISPRAVTGDTGSAWTVVDALRRYEAELASPWRYVLIGTALLTADVFLVRHIRPWLSFESFPDGTETLFAVLKWVVFPDIWLWSLITAGWPGLMTAFFIHRLPREIDLRVIPSHPDQCGGLRPIGDLCLQVAFIALILCIVLAYWGSVGRALRRVGLLPEGAIEAKRITQAIVDFGSVAGFVLGGWSFLYPVLGIHELMKERKEAFAQALADVASTFDTELEHAIRAKDGVQIEQAHAQLEALQDSYSRLQNYPIWPIRGITFVTGFVAPNLLSFLGWALNLVSSETAGRALGWIGQRLSTP